MPIDRQIYQYEHSVNNVHLKAKLGEIDRLMDIVAMQFITNTFVLLVIKM